jgi:hypothetical protein
MKLRIYFRRRAVICWEVASNFDLRSLGIPHKMARASIGLGDDFHFAFGLFKGFGDSVQVALIGAGIADGDIQLTAAEASLRGHQLKEILLATVSFCTGVAGNLALVRDPLRQTVRNIIVLAQRGRWVDLPPALG